MSLVYRLLRQDEWPKLAALFLEYGHIPPAPEVATVAIAERGGEIAGCLVLQVVFHMEPIIIRDPKVNFLRLQKILERQLDGNGNMEYYCFSEGDKVARMAELTGMQKVGYQTWRKKI